MSLIEVSLINHTGCIGFFQKFGFKVSVSTEYRNTICARGQEGFTALRVRKSKKSWKKSLVGINL